MAGNIQGLNLAQLEAKIQEYSTTVKGLFECANETRQSITSMRDFWTGQRMNAIIEKYNSVNKALYDNLAFFQIKVENTLRELLEQYKAMEETGKVSDVSFSSGIDPTLLEAIALTETATVKFEQEKVKNLATTVTENLNKLGTDLAKMVTILDDIAPYSDSLNKLVTNYKAGAEEVNKRTLDLKNSLETEINNAIQTVVTTEGYNESDASRVQAGSDSQA